MTVFLETERLVLRTFAGGDADDLYALDSDPAVMRFLTGGAPTTTVRPSTWRTGCATASGP